MNGNSMWLIVLGLLGVLHPFIVRRDSKVARWALYAAQALVGLNSAFWGVWGFIQATMSLHLVTIAPIFWTTTLIAAVLQLALPALFAATALASLLGKGDATQKAKSTRMLSTAQAIAGVLAICVAIAIVVVDLGVFAP